MTENNEVRLDKWLWAARFYKTRSIAKAMIEGGKVHYNGQRAKVSKTVEVGAMIKLRQGSDEKESDFFHPARYRGSISGSVYGTFQCRFH